MKILSMISLLLWAHFCTAETMSVQNSFWKTSVDNPRLLKMTAVQPGLQEDCDEFTNFVFNENGTSTRSADEIAFARRLPLKGQMKDGYEAEFKVSADDPQAPTSESVGFYVADPQITFDLSRITALQYVRMTEGLMQISEQLGLSFEAPNLFRRRHFMANSVFIKISSRDVACDLLAGKVNLSAALPQSISLKTEDRRRLDAVYGELAAQTQKIMQSTHTPEHRAVLLGLGYGKIMGKLQVAESEVPAVMENIFAGLFQDGSLKYSENWRLTPGLQWITYPHEQAVTVSVHIKAVTESELEAVERALNSMRGLSFYEMSVLQRQQHHRLNLKRMSLLKSQIFKKYGAYR